MNRQQLRETILAIKKEVGTGWSVVGICVGEDDYVISAVEKATQKESRFASIEEFRRVAGIRLARPKLERGTK